ncbi:unnamed protein product [Arabis nemorensis]|uniref:Glabrous enhancer-binding protein-like DBD domain-containing protein n=1 Tax=Arabis nemorensis TaxID=586526 RepID=A0A565BD74_9BRAS|nr:unnamed protein product [Arabis nemorensis]
MEEEPSKPVTVTTSSKPKNKGVLASSAAKSSGAAASTPPPPAIKSALKRPATVSEGTSTSIKRAKAVEESDSKKSYFQKVWIEEDDIKLLQGMIDFNADTGKSPFDNINRYFYSVKKSFSFELRKNQFTEKVRGLKKNYLYKGV